MQQASNLAKGDSDRKRNRQKLTSLVPRELSERETERQRTSELRDVRPETFPSLGLERELGV